MTGNTERAKIVRMLLMLALLVCFLGDCGLRQRRETQRSAEANARDYLVAMEDEPDTVDFQCTSIHYTVAQNVFNRLVEMENDAHGGIEVLPSLAERWEVSDDGRVYTFHLRRDVTFSNGSPLTASDVQYTFVRLLTHPGACNQSVAESILGARALENGAAATLEGFEILSDWDFAITLEVPFEAFLACLSMPGASILDEETTEAAGDRFGIELEYTVGTGSFILEKWEPGRGMQLKANPDCWAGAPMCAGLDLRFTTEAEAVRMLFENGVLDIMDLDEIGSAAEYYIHGDIYRERLKEFRQIGITYIALNQGLAPLDDVRVRRALQIGLNRQVLLEAVYSGRGSVENGIYPHGLYGFNPELPALPYDAEAAKGLLQAAGYGDGLEVTYSVKASSTPLEMLLASMVAEMWEKIGVRTVVNVLDEDEFMRLRKTGKLECYAASWTADYNDPDNFIETFFGNRENTTFRSLCYPNEAVMARVTAARSITDPDERLREYRALEQIIVQEDAAWIPLFSRLRYYVTSERLTGFRISWNGSVKNNYRYMAVEQKS